MMSGDPERNLGTVQKRLKTGRVMKAPKQTDQRSRKVSTANASKQTNRNSHTRRAINLENHDAPSSQPSRTRLTSNCDHIPHAESVALSEVVRHLPEQSAALAHWHAFNPNHVVGSVSLNDFDFSTSMDCSADGQHDDFYTQTRPNTSSPYSEAAVEEDDISEFPVNQQSMDQDFGLSRPKPLSRSKSEGAAALPTWLDHRSRVLLDGLGLTKGNLRVDEKGQLHYFGYSSNLQVVSILPSSTPLPAPPSPMESSYENLEELATSSNTKTHLLGLFFKYQNSAMPLVHEQTFMDHYSKGVKTEYFSFFLLHSMLLRSLRLSNRDSIEKLAGSYLSRAKAELLAELENPTVATIQALCIFGHYLGSLGDDRACWLYPGMAYRLIYDLGLHQDSTELVEAGYLTKHDCRVRHFVLWSCFVMDKFYSSFQGRPTTLKLAEISIGRPTFATVGHCHQNLATWVDLAIILDSVIHIINGPSERLSEPETLSELSKTGDRLQMWLKNLPESMKWKAKIGSIPDPGLCALHMQFLTTTILLHRPFAAYMVKGRPVQANQFVRQLTGYTPELSQRICTTNALRIVKLLQAFQRTHGIEKIFSTIIHVAFTAALALISEIATANHDARESGEGKWLKVCFEILAELGTTLPVAGRNLKILFSILESCGYPELMFEAKRQNRNCTKSPARQEELNFSSPTLREASSHLNSAPIRGDTRDFQTDMTDHDSSNSFAYDKQNRLSATGLCSANSAARTNSLPLTNLEPINLTQARIPAMDLDFGFWNPEEALGDGGIDISMSVDMEEARRDSQMMLSDMGGDYGQGTFIGIGQEFGFNFSAYL